MNDSPDTRIPHATAVIVAAGDGTRMRAAGGERKPFLQVEGQAVLAHTCQAFQEAPSVRELVIVAREDDVQRIVDMARGRSAFEKLRSVVPGGATRTDSVRSGVLATDEETRIVLIHDAARLLISTEVIERSIAMTVEKGAALVAVPVSDTIKESPDGASVVRTRDRSQLWAAQTPQAFRRQTILELLERAEAEGFTPTDDAALHEHFIGPIPIVLGDSTNIKLTTPTDLAIVAAILRDRAGSRSSS